MDEVTKHTPCPDMDMLEVVVDGWTVDITREDDGWHVTAICWKNEKPGLVTEEMADKALTAAKSYLEGKVNNG